MTIIGQNYVVHCAAPYQGQPLGYQQLTMTAAALALTVPAGATYAIITVEGSATDTVRWRDDGTPPTSAIGNPIAVLVSPAFTAAQVFATDLTALQFIGASTSKVNANYYR